MIEGGGRDAAIYIAHLTAPTVCGDAKFALHELAEGSNAHGADPAKLQILVVLQDMPGATVRAIRAAIHRLQAPPSCASAPNATNTPHLVCPRH